MLKAPFGVSHQFHHSDGHKTSKGGRHRWPDRTPCSTLFLSSMTEMKQTGGGRRGSGPRAAAWIHSTEVGKGTGLQTGSKLKSGNVLPGNSGTDPQSAPCPLNVGLSLETLGNRPYQPDASSRRASCP